MLTKYLICRISLRQGRKAFYVGMLDYLCIQKEVRVFVYANGQSLCGQDACKLTSEWENILPIMRDVHCLS
jgi:hypothetical protein